MPRKGENIYKRKDGRWEGRYIKSYVNGRAKYGYVYARTYKEIKEKLHGLQKGCQQATACKAQFEGITRSEDEKMQAFHQSALRWMEFHSPQLKKSTINKYKNNLNNYILPRFGDMPIEAITRGEVIAFGNNLLLSGGVNGRVLSPKTVVGTLSVLQSIFEYAAENEKLAVADINKISVRQFQRPFRVLSQHEQQTLCIYLCGELNLVNLGVLTCLYTGIRVGELCALKWKDILIDERTIHVCKTMQRIQNDGDSTPRTSVIISAPKSECSIRKIPIPGQLFKVLVSRKGAANAFFLTGSSTQYLEPRNMQYHFKAILKKCNIENVHFHTLRHTFATRCVEMGFDIKCLSEILGHANVNITLNRYVHPSMDLKQKNMDMLSELFTVK